ncbi:MAG TPA: phospholipase D-like domain-containing protein [Candidatus Saccharimonadia bacterium]|nr:phospholipase D-like domain-containing protein [Candidatus Saccharimonadia bacterium]
MLNLLLRKTISSEVLSSQLLNEESFYSVFTKDINKCLYELIIESPFITNRRLNQLLPTLQKLKNRKVRIVVNTRDPIEHDNEYCREDTHHAISKMQQMGIQVLYTSGHHRKIVIIDRQILYEGSLNVLSQNDSCEVMRRIKSNQLAWQMARFIKIDKFLS